MKLGDRARDPAPGLGRWRAQCPRGPAGAV